MKWKIRFTFIIEHFRANVFGPHCSTQATNHWLAKTYMGINYIKENNVYHYSVKKKKIPMSEHCKCMHARQTITYVWNSVELSRKVTKWYCMIKISYQNWLFQNHRWLDVLTVVHFFRDSYDKWKGWSMKC